jgi:hypothetical protein
MQHATQPAPVAVRSASQATPTPWPALLLPPPGNTLTPTPKILAAPSLELSQENLLPLTVVGLAGLILAIILIVAGRRRV